ncbi:MAG: 2-oxo acid dehydrogenase subunit E2 [Candidatus Promineifilaceae bacterium]|nr:2-oxo acid dehydrogenase subunit E2 [Candidatus Promineifilaceae bacterium]
MVTSIGMPDRGVGWGPRGHPHAEITVGSIVSRPVIVNGQLENRKHLCLTLILDHDNIDGAPVARFNQRLKALILAGVGLPQAA